MKKIFFSLLTTTILVLLSSCSQESQSVQSLQNNEMIKYATEFAKIHNDCLASIYSSSCKNATKGTTKLTTDDIVQNANAYIAKHITTTKSSDKNNDSLNYLVSDTYENTSIEDISNTIPDNAKLYIDNFLEDNEAYENILNLIISDNSLNDQIKQAIICFIMTYRASYDYWQANGNDWLDLTGVNVTRSIRFRFNWKDFAFADAWWGYQGMLSSACNIYVGAGSAAVGSAFSCLH